MCCNGPESIVTSAKPIAGAAGCPGGGNGGTGGGAEGAGGSDGGGGGNSGGGDVDDMHLGTAFCFNLRQN